MNNLLDTIPCSPQTQNLNPKPQSQILKPTRIVFLIVPLYYPLKDPSAAPLIKGYPTLVDGMLSGLNGLFVVLEFSPLHVRLGPMSGIRLGVPKLQRIGV